MTTNEQQMDSTASSWGRVYAVLNRAVKGGLSPAIINSAATNPLGSFAAAHRKALPEISRNQTLERRLEAVLN